LTVAAVFAFGFANAQEATTDVGFAQGDLFVSGGIGFGSTKQGDAKSSDFNFSPAVGYFISENIALGARLDINSGTEENGGPEIKTSGFGVEAFGRYYFIPASKFSVFGELAVGAGSSKREVGNNETKFKTFGVNAGVGVSYFLSNHWAVEASWAGLGYNTSEEDAPGAEA
jgi:outer membrane protein